VVPKRDQTEMYKSNKNGNTFYAFDYYAITEKYNPPLINNLTVVSLQAKRLK
jgi:hypothetical protein